MRIRLWEITLTVLLLIAVGSVAAHAIPSLSGPTGIVTVPTAAVAPSDQLQAALTYQSQTIGEGTDSMDFNCWALNVLLGAADEAELWGAYALADQETPTASETARLSAIGGKYQLTREPEDQASLAVGASLEEWSGFMFDPGSTTDLSITKAYVVATKDFTPLAGETWEWSSQAGTHMLGSLGVIYISLDPEGGESDSLARPFLGLEFAGAGGTTLGLEYRWKDDDLDAKAVFSAVLRHRMSDKVEAEIGTTNGGPGGLGLDDQDFFVRLGYSIPLGGIR